MFKRTRLRNQNCDYCGCNLISEPEQTEGDNSFCSILCHQLFVDGISGVQDSQQDFWKVLDAWASDPNQGEFPFKLINPQLVRVERR